MTCFLKLVYNDERKAWAQLAEVIFCHTLSNRFNPSLERIFYTHVKLAYAQLGGNMLWLRLHLIH